MTGYEAIGRGAAPGKVILFGEHAVVYGQPAVAAALGHGLGVTVLEDETGPTLSVPRWTHGGLTVRPEGRTESNAMARALALALELADYKQDTKVRITVDGELPLGVGLGSSAAFSVALLRGLTNFRGRDVTEQWLLEAAGHLEMIFHGAPSGLDHTVATTGKCLRFIRTDEPQFRPVGLVSSLPLVLAWTPRDGTTADAVLGVSERRRASQLEYDSIFEEIGALCDQGVEALQAGDLVRVGGLFDENQDLLRRIGVSSQSNEAMLKIAHAHGVLGAKLTGAGHGGAVIALCPERPRELAQKLSAAGFSALFTSVGGPRAATP